MNNKEEPKVLTRMRLSCCWGDNLNEKELNEVVDYINWLQQKVNKLETNWNNLKNWLKANDLHYTEAIPFKETLNKMQELERIDINE